MIARHEHPENTQPIAKREDVITEKEQRPYQQEREIRQLEPVFQTALAQYQQELAGDDQLPTPEQLQASFPEITRKEKDLVAAARFFALVHAIEHRRTDGRHLPNWPQTETALYMLAHPYRGEVQRIEMGTGEGKTFVIGLVALWRTLSGEDVMVHTDKEGNVGQSYQSVQPLYELFGVECERALFSALSNPERYRQYFLRTAEFPAFARAHREGREYTPKPRVRYGVWSQFIHEWLQLRVLAAQLEHQLAGKTAQQRRPDGTFAPLEGPQRQALEVELAWVKLLLQTNAVLADEGDQYIDLETNDAVLSQESGEEYSEEEQVRMKLAWSIFHLEQDEQTFARISQALHQDQELIEDYYAVQKRRASEGEQGEDDHYVITEARSQVNFDRLYRSSLIDIVTDPSRMTQLLDTYLNHRDAFPTAEHQHSARTLKNIRRALKQSIEGERIHWQRFADQLPPPTRSDIEDFLSIKYPIFDYRHLYTREIAKILRRSDDELRQEDTTRVCSLLRDRLPDFDQLLAVSRLVAVADQVWLDVFNTYSSALVRTEELTEGNDYQRVRQQKRWPDGRVEEKILIRVVGENREPQPGKEFDEAVAAFLHLRHELPFPQPKMTTASISPALWYQMMATEGVDISSVSGSQDAPHFVAESTGQGVTEVLPTQVFPDKEHKHAQIVEFIRAHQNRPILLCAQDITELKILAKMLEEQFAPQDMIMLDAAHAAQANTYVPQLAPGKIVLLQISARGQDFGRMMQSEEHGTVHTFQDGLIVSATALSNPHLQTQLEGRLGGKRPSGQMITFTSLEDPVIQQRYLYRPELREQQEKRFAQLEAERAAQTPNPQRIQQLMDKIAHTHLDAVEYQQRLNLIEAHEHRRRQLVIGATVEKIWTVLMSPDENTPLGKALATVTYEEKQGLADMVFAEAPLLYPISTKDISSQSLTEGARRSSDEQKHQRFFTDLAELVKDVVLQEQLHASYSRIRGEFPKAQLPERLDELSLWLDEYRSLQYKKGVLRQQRHALTGKHSTYNIPRRLSLPERKLADLDSLAQRYHEQSQQTPTTTLLRNLSL